MAERIGSNIWTRTVPFQRATDEEVKRHLPLLKKMLNLHFYGDALTYEEKWAAGMIGIAFAIERFDPSMDVKYSYWITYQIDVSIRNEARRIIAQRKKCRPVGDLASSSVLVDNHNNESVRKRDDWEEISRDVGLMREAMAILDEKERRIVQRIAFDGASQFEVGREEGKSQSRISKIHRAALDKMRRYIDRKKRERQICP